MKFSAREPKVPRKAPPLHPCPKAPWSPIAARSWKRLPASVNQQEQDHIIEVITPDVEGERGCQVSMLMLKNGRAVFESLTEQGVIADWREPNVIRVAPVPLYNTFEDVFRFGEIIQHSIQQLQS